MSKVIVGLGTAVALAAVAVVGCGGTAPAPGSERGPCLANGACTTGLVCLSSYCVRPSGTDGGIAVQPLVVSTATRTPRTTTWSINYWQWLSSADGIPGTEPLVAALEPAMLRIGGYNNDSNVPNPFGDAQLDTAVAYARAIGAEPIVQVPLLGDDAGRAPTSATAAAMVTYTNVTMGYGIKYFSIGNEPDLYGTQGSLTNQALPALPGYTPSDYCASATAYVAAMKAVDPTIQIVGPDLSNKYQAGNDWLTPILTQCGGLFDIVSIHRYPFSAKQSTLAAAAGDAASFRYVVGQVRDILRATGFGDKPLALTEMNISYEAATCVLDASPGTVGSALWLADSIGTAIELGLWTSAVWDISDTDYTALGLIGMPPSHTPRPPYYAYALYADHFGPTLLNVTAAPAGVSAHASRNQADDATGIIVVNWNQSPAGVELAVTGLAAGPPSITFVLPPVSTTAMEVPDTGAASAWTYGESQRETASGPQVLPAGTGSIPATGIDGGNGDPGAGKAVGTHCGADAAFVCPQIALASPAITTTGTAEATMLTFGAGANEWQSYTYAAPGQSAPTATLTPDGTGIEIVGGFVAPISGNWEGVGLFFAGPSCIDASKYTGVKFDFSGDLGGCSLAFGAGSSDDLSFADDQKGGCPGTDSDCYGPLATVVPGTTTTLVPFSTLTGGAPAAKLNPTTLVDVQWQLSGPLGGSNGGACSADFTVRNVSFY